MRLTKDFIFKHIRDTKFPIWGLYLVQSYKRVPLAFYNGDDFAENDTPEAKAEKSCERLASTLQDFPAEAVLSIDIKTCKNANGSGILGPFEFVNVDKDSAPEIPQTPSAFAGFGNFAQPPQGWVSEQVLNAKLDELRNENKRQINELIFKQREKDFEDRMQRERKELDELRRELRDEKRKYENGTGKVASTLAGAAKIVLGDMFPGLANFDNAETVAQLSGTQPQLQPAPAPEPPQHDAKYQAIEQLAEMLYKDSAVTTEQVASLIEGIKIQLKTKSNGVDVNFNKPTPESEPVNEKEVSDAI